MGSIKLARYLASCHFYLLTFNPFLNTCISYCLCIRSQSLPSLPSLLNSRFKWWMKGDWKWSGRCVVLSIESGSLDTKLWRVCRTLLLATSVLRCRYSTVNHSTFMHGVIRPLPADIQSTSSTTINYLIPVVVTIFLERFRIPAPIAQIPSSSRLRVRRWRTGKWNGLYLEMGERTTQVEQFARAYYMLEKNLGATIIHSGPCWRASYRCGNVQLQRKQWNLRWRLQKEEKLAKNQSCIVSLIILKILWPTWDVQIVQKI